jgi:hypothetical protein
MKRLFLVSVLFLLGAGLKAQEPSAWDGRELLSNCREAERLFEARTPLDDSSFHKASTCISYLEGTRDAILTLKLTGKTSLKICVPLARVRELTRAVLKWLTEHPERMSEWRSTLVLAAMTDSYPCPER